MRLSVSMPIASTVYMQRLYFVVRDTTVISEKKTFLVSKSSADLVIFWNPFARLDSSPLIFQS